MVLIMLFIRKKSCGKTNRTQGKAGNPSFRGLPAFSVFLSSCLVVTNIDTKSGNVFDEIAIFYLMKSNSRYLGRVQSSSLTTNSNLSI